MTLEELLPISTTGTLILESMPNALYQAYFERDGRTHCLLDRGAPVRGFSIGKMHEILGDYRFQHVFLRQSSPYDEMIGQPLRDNNTLAVPLSWGENAMFNSATSRY